MQYDFSPLKQKPTHKDIKQLKDKYFIYTYVPYLNFKEVPNLLLLIVLLFIGSSLILEASGNTEVLVINIILGCLISTILFIYMFSKRKIFYTNIFRISSFATLNNLLYRPKSPDPNYNGMIFNLGLERYAYDQIIAKNSSGSFEIANFGYIYRDNEGHKHESNCYSYVTIELDEKLPHIVLDSKANNSKLLSISNLPEGFDKNQVLSLEGDFDKFFTLYAPFNYKTDALYIFTPDLMELFIDESHNFDAEIIDNRLYIYSSKWLNLSDEKILQKIFSIIEKIGSKLKSREANYHDSRVMNENMGSIAPDGYRLKTKMTTRNIVLLFLFFTYIAYSLTKLIIVVIQVITHE